MLPGSLSGDPLPDSHRRTGSDLGADRMPAGASASSEPAAWKRDAAHSRSCTKSSSESSRTPCSRLHRRLLDALLKGHIRLQSMFHDVRIRTARLRARAHELSRLVRRRRTNATGTSRAPHHERRTVEARESSRPRHAPSHAMRPASATNATSTANITR